MLEISPVTIPVVMDLDKVVTRIKLQHNVTVGIPPTAKIYTAATELSQVMVVVT